MKRCFRRHFFILSFQFSLLFLNQPGLRNSSRRKKYEVDAHETKEKRKKTNKQKQNTNAKKPGNRRD